MKHEGKTRKTRPVVSSETTTMEDLADLPIWAPCVVVTARHEGEAGRRIKVPLRKCGCKWARVNRAEDWMTREEAEKVAESHGPNNGVGIRLGLLPDGSGWILAGIDNDGSRLNGVPLDWETAITEAFETHCHVSQSGNGSHVLFLATRDDLDGLKQSGLIKAEFGRKFGAGDHVEIAAFYGGKFFAVTDQVVSQDAIVRRVSMETQAWLLGDFGPKWAHGTRLGSDRALGLRSSPRASSRDDSGSGYGFRYCMRAILSERCERDEAPDVCSEFFEQIDPEHPAAEWWWRATDRDRERTPVRAWEAAQAHWNDAERCEAFLNELDEE